MAAPTDRHYTVTITIKPESYRDANFAKGVARTIRYVLTDVDGMAHYEEGWPDIPGLMWLWGLFEPEDITVETHAELAT